MLSSVGWLGLAITVAFCGLVGRSRGDLAFYEVIRSTLDLSVPLGLTAAASGVALWKIDRAVATTRTTQWRTNPRGRTPLGERHGVAA